MGNFWDFSVWGGFNLVAVLLLALLVANVMKKGIKPLKASLIPTSVLGGGILLAIAGIYKLITGNIMFDEPFFGGNGMANLESITYHALALGFIASTYKTTKGKLNKERTTEIFNTGVTTVSTYLLQAILGMGITMVAALIMKDFFSAAGMLLPFGYGQGTGQALNYGIIYENEYGFDGGRSFGLTIAALGFLSASIGGVIHLELLKKHKKININNEEEGAVYSEEIQSEEEIPTHGSMDKLTVQLAFIALAYLVAFFLMYVLGNLVPSMKSVIYGFNFLLGVLAVTIIKQAGKVLKKLTAVKKQYTNGYLMTRISNALFDIMVVAGIAAIRLGILEKYWGVISILGISGLVFTYLYNRLVAQTLFKNYPEEQFLAMYGMLTGTASTGVILLREIDGHFKTPAADNMVYQNFPAIVFGLPMMVLATLAPTKPGLTMVFLVVFFIIMNVILFRSVLFARKKRK